MIRNRGGGIIIKKILLSSVLVNHLFAIDYFSLHNINKAHSMGLSGQGIKIGIIDNYFHQSHQSLKNNIIEIKDLYTNNGSSTIDAENKYHGSHVAGLILGSKISNNPYGVAYNTKFYGLSGIGSSNNTQNGTSYANSATNVYDYYNNKDIKIINNSWSHELYPFENTQTQSSTETPQDYVKRELDSSSSIMNSLYKLSKEKKVLILFASGNSGKTSSNYNSVLPSYYDEVLRSWISVGALNDAYITKNGDKITIGTKGVAEFGNHFKNSSAYSIMASGYNLRSVDITSDSAYKNSSGTSMAVAVVSGAAALVVERFPFLNGAQIADVLLSTTNKNYEAPKFILKSYSDNSGQTTQNSTNKTNYSIIYIDASAVPDENTIKADLKKEYPDKADEIIANLNGNKSTATKEEIFGAGILDVGKALNGLAILDANRLNENDVKTISSAINNTNSTNLLATSSTNNSKAAYYTLDLSSHNAIFSNDIGQKKWDNKLHYDNIINTNNLKTTMANLDVGFIKKGTGTLTLSGANTYLGDTIIEQGTMKLSKRADRSGGSMASNVIVKNGSKLEISDTHTSFKLPSNASVTLNKDLSNNGEVIIGNDKLAILDIKGKYTQEANAILTLSFNDTGNSTIKASNYDIKSGSKLTFKPLIGQISPYTTSIKLNLGGLQDQLSNFTQSVQSSSLNASVNNGSINISLKDNAYQNYSGSNASMAKVLRNIVSNYELNSVYNSFFTDLNSSDNNSYINSLESLDDSSYLANTQRLTRLNSKLAFNNMIFNIKENKNKISFNPNYAISNIDDYKANAFSSIIQGLKIIDDDTKLSSYLGYTFSEASFDNANINSNILSIGLSINNSFDKFNIINAFNLGYASNKLQRTLISKSTQNSLDANYNNFYFSTQIGLIKDYNISNNKKLSPMIYANYIFTNQGPIKEKGAIFTKNYDKSSNNSISIALGANYNYELIKANKKSLEFNLYGFYENYIVGNELKNYASFIDYPKEKFNQNYKGSASLFRLGAYLDFYRDKFYIGLGLDNEFGSSLNNTNINIRLNYNF